MRHDVITTRSRAASIAFNVLDPIPYGLFIGALVFDAIYAGTAEVLWFKGAAWLIAIGLLCAIVPRLINLVRVWFPGAARRAAGEMWSFWLNLFAIVAAIVNAFVHSRDAFAVMPSGLWLSCLTIALLVLARAMPTLRQPRAVVAS